MRRMKTKTNQERRTRTETEKKEIINPVADLVQPISSTTYTSFPQFFISTVQGLISREFFNSKLSMKTVNKLSRNCKQTCERLRGNAGERGNVTERGETPRLRGRRKLQLGFIARVR